MRSVYEEATQPANDIVAVTRSDATDDPNGPFRALVMDAVGAVRLHTTGGADVSLPSGLLAAGSFHAIQFTRIWSTGTGAQNIFGLK